MKMKSIKLRTKLLANAVFVSIILFSIGAVSYEGLIRLEKMEMVTEKLNNVNELSLKLRKHEKDFLARDIKDSLFFENKESKYLSKFDVDFNQVITILEELEKDMVDFEEVDSNLYLLHHHMETYSESFKAISEEYYIKGYKDWGKVGISRTNTQNMIEIINKDNLGRELRTSLILLRLYEEIFFSRYEIEYQDLFNEEIKNFKKILDSKKGISSARKNHLRTELESYQTSFNEIVDEDIKIGLTEEDGMKKNMRTAVQKIEPLLDLINLEVKVINERIHKNVKNSNFIFIIIGLLIAVLYGLYLTKNIMKQLGGEPNIVADIAEEISNGNLKIETSNSEKSIGVMKSMYKMVKNLRDMIGTITASSTQIASASQQMSSASEQLAQNSSEQAASTEEISTSLEQMVSVIDSNLEKAKITGEIAKNTSKGASESQKIFFETIDSVNEISKKTSIIAEISDKTDILSINAAIEAAGAGEHGKGFAVLAQEIRKLADRTKAASVEIGKLSGHGQEISNAAGKQLEGLLPDIIESASLMNDLIVANEEQKNGIGMINTSVEQLAQITNDTSASSEELAASAEELASQSEQLKNTIEKFIL